MTHESTDKSVTILLYTTALPSQWTLLVSLCDCSYHEVKDKIHGFLQLYHHIRWCSLEFNKKEMQFKVI